jgi:hypothetical protein
VKKLALSAATAAAFFCSGFALSNQAKADDWSGDRHYVSAPIGEIGARLRNQCWVDTSGGAYFGYWAPCAPAKVAKR